MHPSVPRPRLSPSRNPASVRRVICALAAAAAVTSAARAQTPVDTGWTYQGRMTDNGAPANGPYDLRFTLFQDDQGTLQNGATLDMPGVQVDSGLFTARLDFGPLFAGFKNWLQVEISPAGAGTYEALPLQEITSAPQSLFAQTLGLPYSASADIPGPGSVLTALNADATDGTGLWGESAGQQGTGVHGLASSTSGFNFGGDFVTNSTDGRGVRANATAATGLAVGGRFASASNAGIGVWSTATAPVGTTYGVYGDSFSSSGFGVFGRASATGGPTNGVWGEAASTSGTGVFGYATAATGFTSGVAGQSQSTDGVGVVGYAAAGSGATSGVTGSSQSTGGVGVRGTAYATSGFTYGADFASYSPDGRGLRGAANATTGLAIGGRLVSASNAGIAAWCTASATSGVNYGVYGDTNSPSGFGGYFKNSGTGGTALWVDGIAQCKTLRILGGSDLAEPFNVTGADGKVEPGMVVVIDEAHPGDLRLSDQPYDTRVAGVISGANNLSPGMVMKAEGQDKADGAHPIAMTGRVWCYVDASFGAVKPGDRLTTCATPGYAMKADDAGRCGGAVIGKAMTELKEGKGLVLVLVNLQ